MIPAENAPVLRPTEEDPDALTGAGADYVLHQDATSVWVTVDGLSVYIRRSRHADGAGVVIDVLPLNDETGDSLGTLYVREDQISQPEA